MHAVSQAVRAIHGMRMCDLRWRVLSECVSHDQRNKSIQMMRTIRWHVVLVQGMQCRAEVEVRRAKLSGTGHGCLRVV